MAELKLEVPAELRQLAEKTIDQAEKAFGLFFDAARRSSSAPTPAAEFSEQVLAFSQQSLKTDFEHARKVVSSAIIEEIATAQSELVKSRITGAEHHIRELARALGPRPELQLLEWLKLPDEGETLRLLKASSEKLGCALP